MLKSGGFEMSKWATNNKQLSDELQLNSSSEIQFQSEAGVLGMVWLPSSDELRLKITAHDIDKCHRLTKRDIVSRISQIYDPSSVFGPVIVQGKLIIQDLWKVKDLR